MTNSAISSWIKIVKKQEQQPLMDFENGVIVKIHKSSVDPIQNTNSLKYIKTLTIPTF